MPTDKIDYSRHKVTITDVDRHGSEIAFGPFKTAVSAIIFAYGYKCVRCPWSGFYSGQVKEGDKLSDPLNVEDWVKG
jgi:hypothetical protein